MLIDFIPNTNETKVYRCNTSTIYTSGKVENNDIKTLIEIMQNNLNYANILILKHTMLDLFDAKLNDVIKVVEQATKKAKINNNNNNNIYCYKYKVHNNNIIIYIGCTEKYLYLE